MKECETHWAASPSTSRSRLNLAINNVATHFVIRLAAYFNYLTLTGRRETAEREQTDSQATFDIIFINCVKSYCLEIPDPDKIATVIRLAEATLSDNVGTNSLMLSRLSGLETEVLSVQAAIWDLYTLHRLGWLIATHIT